MIPKEIVESSGIAFDEGRNLFWTIQDSNNGPLLYAFDEEGKLTHKTLVENIKNKDWEDVLIDGKGDMYIGDFGNNDKKRDHYKIYKVSSANVLSPKATATVISFKLEGKKEKDFEAFILKDEMFYLFSKEEHKTVVYKIPNQEGKHEAQKVTTYKFDTKGEHRITSAALSKDQKTIVLLNHSKLWKLSNFEGDQFFSGNIDIQEFKHTSQKEGICFKNEHSVYITDENEDNRGGKLYELEIEP